MQALYDKLPDYNEMRGIETLGKRIDYTYEDGNSRLTVRSIQTGEVELSMAMPIIHMPSENPENDCSAEGRPLHSWYEPSLRILIIQLDFGSTRDGCEQPEQWLFRQL